MSAPHSRANPSPRYRELVALYRDMHIKGEEARNLAPEDTYPGQNLMPHVGTLHDLIRRLGCRTVLDYGAGKGLQYEKVRAQMPDGRELSIQELWSVDAISCYDAAYPPFTDLPDGTFDAVISTDVLEHCPEEDVPWIIEEMFSYANKLLFAVVACYPAMATLPNGENAHCTVHGPDWWQPIVEAAAAKNPAVRYRIELQILRPDETDASKQAPHILTNIG